MDRIPRTLVGFVVVNAGTFGLDLGIVSLTHGVGGWPLPASVALGYAIAFSLSFALNRRFSFRSAAPVGFELLRYAGVIAVNFLVILLGLTTLLSAAGVQYQLARIVAGACEAVFMYCAMRWFVFRRPRPESERPSRTTAPRLDRGAPPPPRT